MKILTPERINEVKALYEEEQLTLLELKGDAKTETRNILHGELLNAKGTIADGRLETSPTKTKKSEA